MPRPGGRDRDQPSEKKTKVILSPEEAETRAAEPWSGLDMSAVGFHMISPSLFKMEYLTFIYLNQNNLSFIPAEIARLSQLTLIDLSHNKLRTLPPELGKLKNLKELLLFQNQLSALPFELGSLFQLNVLGLHGNQLNEPLHTYAGEGTETVMTYLLDNLPISEAPPGRQWIPPTRADLSRIPAGGPAPETEFSCFCFNVLCDKYATRQIYAYCPSWALDWDYRKQQILKEISTQNSDLILLQEVETQEFYGYFQPELHQRGYEGVFSPKSRARTMNDHDRKHVDGCAIFYRCDVFEQKAEHLVEFERLGASHGAGSADMLNRVMPKDNIAVVVMLEHKITKKAVCATNAHLTWDPEFKDVKVVQAVMLLHEVEKIMDKHVAEGGARPALVLGGDFNSKPDSGVFQFVNSGSIAETHPDLIGRDYKTFAANVGFSHKLKLKSCYHGEMPYTNYTHDFTGIIDYVFYNTETIVPTTLLGPVEPEAMATFDGCPNPHFPSDHFSISAKLTLL